MCCTIITITLGVLIQVSQGVVFYQHTTEYLYHCTPSSTVLLQQVERDGRPLKGLSAMDGEGGGEQRHTNDRDRDPPRAFFLSSL